MSKIKFAHLSFLKFTPHLYVPLPCTLRILQFWLLYNLLMACYLVCYNICRLVVTKEYWGFYCKLPWKTRTTPYKGLLLACVICWCVRWESFLLSIDKCNSPFRKKSHNNIPFCVFFFKLYVVLIRHQGLSLLSLVSTVKLLGWYY